MSFKPKVTQSKSSKIHGEEDVSLKNARRKMRQAYKEVYIHETDSKQNQHKCKICDYIGMGASFSSHYKTAHHKTAESQFLSDNPTVLASFIEKTKKKEVMFKLPRSLPDDTDDDNQTIDTEQTIKHDDNELCDENILTDNTSNIPRFPLHYRQTMHDVHKMSSLFDEQQISQAIGTSKLSSFNQMTDDPFYLENDFDFIAPSTGIDKNKISVCLVSSQSFDSREFEVNYYPVLMTDRLKLLDKNNKQWQSNKGNEFFLEQMRKSPGTFVPTAEGKVTIVEQNWYASIGHKMTMEYNKMLTNGTYTNLMMIDPIFNLRRFPSQCWGLDFSDLLKFFKIYKGDTRSVSPAIKSTAFISVITKMYPSLISTEIGIKKNIQKGLMAYKLLREYELSQSNANITSSLEENTDCTDYNTDTDSHGFSSSTSSPVYIEEIDDTIDKNSFENSQVCLDDQNGLDSSDVMDSRELVDIFLPKVNRPVDFYPSKEEKEPKTNSKTSANETFVGCENKCYKELNERILPIVLFPFFMDSLHASKKYHNPIISLSVHLLRKLEQHRNLMTLESNIDTMKLASLDLTIIQFRVNLDLYINTKHLENISLECQLVDLKGLFMGMKNSMIFLNNKLEKTENRLKSMEVKLRKNAPAASKNVNNTEAYVRDSESEEDCPEEEEEEKKEEKGEENKKKTKKRKRSENDSGIQKNKKTRNENKT